MFALIVLTIVAEQHLVGARNACDGIVEIVDVNPRLSIGPQFDSNKAVFAIAPFDGNQPSAIRSHDWIKVEAPGYKLWFASGPAQPQAHLIAPFDSAHQICAGSYLPEPGRSVKPVPHALGKVLLIIQNLAGFWLAGQPANFALLERMPILAVVSCSVSYRVPILLFILYHDANVSVLSRDLANRVAFIG